MRTDGRPGGRDDVHGYYGPGSITWRLTRERVMLLGGTRALLLQVAHPLVAAGVAQHSSFKADPLKRLYRTLDMTLAMVFGSRMEADEAAAQINHVHTFVKGTLPEDAGRFEAGHPYTADDPDLKLWVHATLIDTTLQVYPRYVAPLTPAEMEQAYQESKIAARLLDVPEEVIPPTLADFRAYFERMVASDAIAVAPFQRELGQDVLYPPLRGVPKFTFELGVAITAGLLPPKVRDAYGIEFTRGRRRLFEWSPKLVHGILPVLPGAARLMPHARRAFRRTGV